MKRTAVVASLFLTGAAQAHHGISNFDLNTDIELDGVVTRVQFVNPHSWLYLDVTDANGKTVAYKCELRGVTVLKRSGWSEAMFPPGMRIRVTGSPDRREPATCYTGTIYFPDGSSVDRYGQLTSAPKAAAAADRPARRADGKPNLAGDWAREQVVMTDPRGQRGTLVPLSVADQFEPGEVPKGGQPFPGARGTAISLAKDPVDAYWNQRGSLLPLTERGKEVMRDFDGSSADNPRLRCEPTNILFDWTFEEDINRIVQTDDEVRLLYGSWGLDRTIHLDRSAPPANVPLKRTGYSVGRWEGDTLVVETTAFLPGILSADGRLPHGSNLRVTERFELDSKAGALHRSYVAVDPEYFEGEYRGEDTVYLSALPYHGTTPCQVDE
jgi:hypothetical protein